MRSMHRTPLFFLALALAMPRVAEVDAQFGGGAAAAPLTTLAMATPVAPPPRPIMPELVPPGLSLSSASILVVDDADRPLYAKRTRDQRPIASITKLMTAMVVLDAAAPLDESVTILEEDRDQLRHSRSRLRIDRSATLTRREVLACALMSSDNRAASALGRTTFPGGKPAFVEAMNRKAADLGMTESRFADPTGLDGNNISTAEDLVKMVRAAAGYALIREITTSVSMEVHPYGDGGTLHYRNTNPLVQNPDWHLELSKTGFVNEAGHCLVMRAVIGGRVLSIVLLDSPGKRSPVGDSNRLRKWLESRTSGRLSG